MRGTFCDCKYFIVISCKWDLIDHPNNTDISRSCKVQNGYSWATDGSLPNGVLRTTASSVLQLCCFQWTAEAGMLVCVEGRASEGFPGPGPPGSCAPSPFTFHWHIPYCKGGQETWSDGDSRKETGQRVQALWAMLQSSGFILGAVRVHHHVQTCMFDCSCHTVCLNQFHHPLRRATSPFSVFFFQWCHSRPRNCSSLFHWSSRLNFYLPGLDCFNMWPVRLSDWFLGLWYRTLIYMFATEDTPSWWQLFLAVRFSQCQVILEA